MGRERVVFGTALGSPEQAGPHELTPPAGARIPAPDVSAHFAKNPRQAPKARYVAAVQRLPFVDCQKQARARFFGLALLSTGCASGQPDATRQQQTQAASVQTSMAGSFPAPAKASVANPAAESASVSHAMGNAPAQPEADPKLAATGPRVYARTRYVWIRPEPDASKEWIGYLWTGGAVALKSAKPVSGPGCMEWYAIEPRGYVCVDGNRATLDANDPVYRAVLPYAPNLSSPWPHQYGESLGLDSALSLPGSPLGFPPLPLAIHEPRNQLHPR